MHNIGIGSNTKIYNIGITAGIGRFNVFNVETCHKTLAIVAYDALQYLHKT